jgi:two-component system, chemotaxis family, chemotaxis protein CheY
MAKQYRKYLNFMRMEQAKPIIAVVDDDDIFMIIARKMIAFCAPHWHIMEFINGERMLDHFKQHAADPAQLPDLILLDINMPVMDGWMFLDEYKYWKDKIQKPNRIYLTSSSIDTKDIERARQNALLRDYIVKPLSQDVLRKITAPA